MTNYISALEYPDNKSNLWQNFWPADVHVVGKDILRFHAVYWPAFLMAAGLKPPKKIFAHGWWTVDGEKMSKSTGNVIDPFKIIKKYGLDQFKYFLLREMRFGKDGDFSEKALINRINADLSNDFGNLVQRVLSFVYKNCKGEIPKPDKFLEVDNIILNEINLIKDKVIKFMNAYMPTDALEEIWNIIRKSNTYVDSQAPWVLKNDNINRMNTVLYVLLILIKKIALLTQSFIPEGSDRILNQLSIPKEERGHEYFDKNLDYNTSIIAPSGIYPRIDDRKLEEG